MKFLFTIFSFCISLEGSCFAIPDSLNYYNTQINSIDSTELKPVIITWDQLQEEMDPYDHGAEIKLFVDSTGLRKAEISYGLSQGPMILTLYFRDTVPFYIRQVTKQYHFDQNEGSFNYDKPMKVVEKKELYIYDWKNNYCFNLMDGKESETGPIQHPFSPHDYSYDLELVLKYYNLE